MPLQMIFESNEGPGVQYRNKTIVINTRSDRLFNRVYSEAVSKMNQAIESTVNHQIEKITRKVNTDITEEIPQIRKQIEDDRRNNQYFGDPNPEQLTTEYSTKNDHEFLSENQV